MKLLDTYLDDQLARGRGYLVKAQAMKLRAAPENVSGFADFLGKTLTHVGLSKTK